MKLWKLNISVIPSSIDGTGYGDDADGEDDCWYNGIVKKEK